jgi:hypothetical protein
MSENETAVIETEVEATEAPKATEDRGKTRGRGRYRR